MQRKQLTKMEAAFKKQVRKQARLAKQQATTVKKLKGKNRALSAKIRILSDHIMALDLDAADLHESIDTQSSMLGASAEVRRTAHEVAAKWKAEAQRLSEEHEARLRLKLPTLKRCDGRLLSVMLSAHGCAGPHQRQVWDLIMSFACPSLMGKSADIADVGDPNILPKRSQAYALRQFGLGRLANLMMGTRHTQAEDGKIISISDDTTKGQRKLGCLTTLCEINGETKRSSAVYLKATGFGIEDAKMRVAMFDHMEYLAMVLRHELIKAELPEWADKLVPRPDHLGDGYEGWDDTKLPQLAAKEAALCGEELRSISGGKHTKTAVGKLGDVSHFSGERIANGRGTHLSKVAGTMGDRASKGADKLFAVEVAKRRQALSLKERNVRSAYCSGHLSSNTSDASQKAVNAWYIAKVGKVTNSREQGKPNPRHQTLRESFRYFSHVQWEAYENGIGVIIFVFWINEKYPGMWVALANPLGSRRWVEAENCIHLARMYPACLEFLIETNAKEGNDLEKNLLEKLATSEIFALVIGQGRRFAVFDQAVRAFIYTEGVTV